jgi:hypothetical protein
MIILEDLHHGELDPYCYWQSKRNSDDAGTGSGRLAHQRGGRRLLGL